MIDEADTSTLDMFGENSARKNHAAIDSEILDLETLIRDVVQKSLSSPEMRQRAKELFCAGTQALNEMDF